jgi:hypothetical protein
MYTVKHIYDITWHLYSVSLHRLCAVCKNLNNRYVKIRHFRYKIKKKVFRHEGPPLWSSGQRSWLKIQRSRFDSRGYHIFLEVLGLKRCPLRIWSTTEELLGRKSSGSGLENRECGCRDPSCCPRGTLSPQTLALTLSTSGGRSVSIVRSRTQATDFYSDMKTKMYTVFFQTFYRRFLMVKM